MKHVTMSVDFGLQVEWTGILDDIETSVKNDIHDTLITQTYH